jgi:hypothetical protein
VRQHHRVRLGVRQVPSAAENVAELVMQRHAHAAQHEAAQPRAVQRIATRVDVAWRAHDGAQRAGERADRFLGEQVDDRVAVLGVEPFDRMRDRVQGAHRAHAHGQVERQQRVVDHHARQHACIAAGGSCPSRSVSP